jgi:hypothetical protein
VIVFEFEIVKSWLSLLKGWVKVMSGSESGHPLVRRRVDVVRNLYILPKYVLYH